MMIKIVLLIMALAVSQSDCCYTSSVEPVSLSGLKGAILVIGGGIHSSRTDYVFSSKVRVINSELTIPDLPIKTFDPVTIVYNGSLLICGSQAIVEIPTYPQCFYLQGGKNKEYKWVKGDTAYKFPVRGLEFSKVPNKPNEIMLSGGRSDYPVDSNVHILRSLGGSWERDENLSLPVGLAYHCAVVHGSNLFMIGGFSNGKTINAVFRYNTEKKGWTVEKKMNARRQHHECIVRDEYIWVFGGQVFEYGNNTEYFAKNIHDAEFFYKSGEVPSGYFESKTIHIERFSLTSRTWEDVDVTVPSVKQWGRVVLLDGKFIYLPFEFRNPNDVDSMKVLHMLDESVSPMEWVATSDEMEEPNEYFSATVVQPEVLLKLIT